MADGKITIDTQIDSTGIDKGLKETNSKLDQFKNKMKSSDLGKIAGAVAGIGVAFKAVSTAVKATVKEVKALEEAYKKQKNAEIQLDTAIKNSPLLSSESSKSLREFASEMQKITTYGDEQLLPFIAQLVNSGRTEQEAMDIMTAAADIAASGFMDLGSAVSALNMTLQGNAGTLGRQISAVKNLTTEELKAGKAIEIIKKQFSGTAAEVAQTTGSAEQLKNAWGDLREEMGAKWEQPLAKVRKWVQGVIDKTTEALRLRRELSEAEAAGDNGTVSQLETRLNAKIQEREALYKKLVHTQELAKGTAKPNAEDIQIWRTENLAIQNAKQSVDYLMKSYIALNMEIGRQTTILKEAKEAEEAKNKADKEAAEAAEEEAKNKTATDKYNEIIAKRDATIKRIKDEAAATGEEVDQQAILNAEMTAYLDIAATPRLTKKTQEHLELVKQLVEKNKELLATEEARQKDAQKGTDFLNSLSAVELEETKSEILRQQLETMDELNDAFVNSTAFAQLDANTKMRIYSEYTQKRKQLEKEITEATEEEAKKQNKSVTEVISTITEYVNVISQTLDEVSKVVTASANAESEKQTAMLEKQYADGLMSLEEYNEKKKQIEKEAARKEYEIQMWEWSASIIQIGINTAQAISKALAEGGAISGVVMASLVGTLGAAQLAAAVANKPVPPSLAFATGGIVPGASYNGDRITANVNSGEMILNARQQLALWKAANGQGGGGSSMNVQIKNYASNDTTVTPQLTEKGLILTVRKCVTDDLQNRKLNTALTSAQNQMNGIKYDN